MRWAEEEAENFENYDFSDFTQLKGVRFSAAFKVGNLSEEDKSALLDLLAPRLVSIECPVLSRYIPMLSCAC